jgi:hypothetical protein
MPCRHNNTNDTQLSEAPMAEPDEREVLTQEYLAKAAFCELQCTPDRRHWVQAVAGNVGA